MISENVSIVKQRIYDAAKRAGRDASEITLIGVSKTVEAEKVQQAVDAGIKNLGENRVQELVSKFDEVNGAAWHLIGHLQTNKVKHVAEKAVLIHSVDSFRLMDELERVAATKNISVNYLLQVNVSGEETKFGVSPDEVERYVEYAANLQYCRLSGLMTVPPPVLEPSDNKKFFDRLFEISVDIRAKNYDNISMDILSMGMSGDFEAAIECGSTMVRVGSAIFGKRNYNFKEDIRE